MKIAIVAVGYNRPSSMKRLLETIIHSEYGEDDIGLIISLDKGQRQAELIEVAEKIKWNHGEKIIRTFNERQGLRRHILQCGALTEKYDAIVVLEDDLTVSPFFYSYVKQTILRYESEKRVAGISLYKHQTHPGICRPFEPAHNGYDAFFMQFAQSWGQCWTRTMWREFCEWYHENENEDLAASGILPEYIAGWNEQSWLKYYMRYIVETDKYFVYPMISLTSNHSDAGEHCSIPNNDYQVAMLQGEMQFRFPDFSDAIKYDVFFERIGIQDKIFPELKGKKILDLYGGRKNWTDADYIVSTAELPYKKVMRLALQYRPIEVNCLAPQVGLGLYVYDAHTYESNQRCDTNIITRFDIRAIHWKKLLKLGWFGFKDAISTRLRGSKK